MKFARGLSDFSGLSEFPRCLSEICRPKWNNFRRTNIWQNLWLRGIINYHKTAISFKEQAKRRLAALLSGNQNNSPPLLKNSLHGLRSLRQAHTDFDSELKTCAASHVLQTVLFNEIKLLWWFICWNIRWAAYKNWLCGVINAKSYCSASLQGSVYWTTLPDLLCGIMSAEDYVGYAERKRTLKRRSADWRALEYPRGIILSFVYEKHMPNQNVVELWKL